MTYCVIYDRDHSRFIESVNRALANGWQLVGGVSMSEGYTTVRWAQAMVKP